MAPAPTCSYGSHPFQITQSRRKTGSDQSESAVLPDFTDWAASVNLETGVVAKSNFSIPEGYERFKSDPIATTFSVEYDTKRDRFYLMWPRTSEIYVLDGVKLVDKVQPFSSIEFNYQPSQEIPWGKNFTAWVLPKEASENIFLLFDHTRDLILRCTKIKETGAGETNFERTKHYVLSIYSGNWEPKGEYFFDFDQELSLENWFLTSEGLFLNKPEQKTEDEYEFYKIDLSRFTD